MINLKKLIYIIPLFLVLLLVGIKQLKSEPVLKTKTAGAAQVDYFLKLKGVEGETRDEAHDEEIEILSWSWGETSEAALLLPAVQKVRESEGKSSLQDFHFTAHVNKASPILMQLSASGRHLEEAELLGIMRGEEDHEFLKIKLKPILVSSYQTGGSSREIPVDSFSLNFEKIEFEYKTKNEDGSEEVVVRSWDFKKNQKI